MILAFACVLLAASQQAAQPAHRSSAPKSAPILPSQLQPPPQPSRQPLPLPPAPQAEAKPKVVPWEGTLRAGQAKVQELALAQKYDEALALGERLLAMPSWEREPERDRAEALYALGVARGTAEKIDDAAEAFHRASGLAGSDALGLDSIYGAGTFRLLKAEDLRKNIPEVREKLGLQPLPQPAAPPVQLGAPGGPPGPGSAVPSGPAPEPDALSIAREAYMAARKDLVERLRCDTSDRDTRGNLELTQRRLRELDQLEKKRQEEEQKQKDQQKQDDKQDKQKQDPSKQDKQDQKKQDQQKSDDKQQQDPQKPDDQQKQDEQKQDEQKSDPKDAQPKEEKPKDAQPDPKSAQKEQFLSNEEVMRLLDQLQQIEQQAEQVRAALRERHRVPVKKDW